MGLSRGAWVLLVGLGLGLGVGCSDKGDDDVVIGNNSWMDGGAGNMDSGVAPAADAQVDSSHPVVLFDGGK